MKLEKIIAAVDFSNSSLRATEHAVDLARSFDAELHLLHSYRCIPPAMAPHPPAIPPEYLSKVHEAAIESMTEWRNKHCPADMTVIEHVTSRHPCEALAALATKLPADLLVVGTRGLTGLKHVVLGSVAERTVRIAPCPVLTVKAETDADQ